MNTRAWCTAVALAGLVSAVACGGDEGTQPGPSTGAGFGGGATGGTGAFGGTGFGSAGTAAPASIPCGPTTCTTLALPIMLPGFTIAPACCADMARGVCGSTVAGVCTPPPPPAPNCPAPALPIPGVMVNACCIEATQVCGVDASMLGMGCVNLAGFAGPRPTTMCDGTVVPVATAGTGAAAGTAAVPAAGASGGVAAGAGGGAAGASGAAAGASGAAAGASGAAAGRGGMGGGTAGAAGR